MDKKTSINIRTCLLYTSILPPFYRVLVSLPMIVFVNVVFLNPYFQSLRAAGIASVSYTHLCFYADSGVMHTEAYRTFRVGFNADGTRIYRAPSDVYKRQELYLLLS